MKSLRGSQLWFGPSKRVMTRLPGSACQSGFASRLRPLWWIFLMRRVDLMHCRRTELLRESRWLQTRDSSWRTSMRTLVSASFLFDKVKMQVVTKMRTNADLRTVSEKMFSLQVSITGDDLDIMLVKVGNGDQHRLVLLRGHPVQGDGPIPSCFNAGISSEVKEALKNGEGLEDTSHIEHSDEEMDPDALEQQALVEAEEGLDRMEICMDSSDEEVIKPYVPAGGYVRVKTWKDRPAFQKLSQKGLTMIPTHREGVFLSHHTERCTWQGHYPNCDKQMNFKYGGLKGRTLFRMEACFDRNPHSKFFHFAAYLVGLCIYVLFTCLHIHIHIYIYIHTHIHTPQIMLYIYIKIHSACSPWFDVTPAFEAANQRPCSTQSGAFCTAIRRNFPSRRNGSSNWNEFVTRWRMVLVSRIPC